MCVCVQDDIISVHQTKSIWRFLCVCVCVCGLVPITEFLHTELIGQTEIEAQLRGKAARGIQPIFLFYISDLTGEEEQLLYNGGVDDFRYLVAYHLKQIQSLLCLRDLPIPFFFFPNTDLNT